MTQAQRTELDKAIDRAARNGINILAHGTYKATGDVFYVTSSASDPAASHVVTVRGHALVCDCPARCICSHRGAVHTRLAAEREAERDAERARQAEAAWYRESIRTEYPAPGFRGW